MISNLLAKLKAHKTLVIILSGAFLALIVLIVIIALIVGNLKNNNQGKKTQLELADDSQMALLSDVQPYNLSDNTPTFDLYGEPGYQDEDKDYPSVILRSDFKADAKDCGYTDILYYSKKAETREKCVGLSKVKKVIPNHATVQTYNGEYKIYHNNDVKDSDWVNEYAYAILPDGSMVSMSDAKIQFNFYDNETRIVQMVGTAYYRVKAQPEGHKFTVQVGDRIIELSDAETEIFVNLNKTATDKDKLNANTFGKNTGKEIINRVQIQTFNVNIIQFAGLGKMYQRGTTSENATPLDDGENSYMEFKFKNYETRESMESTKEEIEKNKKSFLESYNYTNHALFSVNNYGLGNFNSVSIEDLYNMLMVYFDNASLNAYKSVMQSRKEMNDFTSDWNNFVNKIGSCNEGWYKTTTGTCCPNGTVHNPTNGTCTKTTYYYYCDAGWTLGSDNKCHKQGSNSSGETKTPVYKPGNGSGDGMCVDSSKPASYQLCKMGTTVGTSKMSGSKCCFNKVADPVLN